MKTILIQLFCTKLGWLAICLVLVVIFGTLSNWIDWMQYLMFASLVYPTVLGLIMILFAWVINPIKNRIKK